MDLMQLTAVELGKKIKNKEITVKECVEAALAQIDAVEGQIHSFVTMDREGALKRAEEVQAKIDSGELTGPLAGVPVAIKDNMCTEGLLTFSLTAVRTLSGGMWFMQYKFMITPMLVVFPILLIMGGLVPYLAFRFGRKGTVVEELQKE